MSEKNAKTKQSISSPSNTWTDNFLTRPLTNAPSRVASGIASKMDAPRLDSTSFDPNTKMGKMENTGNIINAMLRGGLAGATEGVGNIASDMTSPVGIMSALMGGAGLGNATNAASKISKITRPTIDILENMPIKQVAPAADEVASLIGDLQRNLAKIPKKKPVIPSPAMPAEMIPRGGEAAYNAGRPMSNIMSGMNPPQMMRSKLPSLQLPMAR